MEELWHTLSLDGLYIQRLMVAALLGGLIGLERQSHGRAAGLRTNILVCVGSAAIIVAFQKLFLAGDPGSTSAIRIDPARAAAGVITGIGFLGAGTIIKSRDFVRGLTTAATIWVVATLGITLGLGEYVIACTLTLTVLATLYILHKVDLPADRYAALTTVAGPGAEGPGDDELAAQGFHVKHRAVVIEHDPERRTEIVDLRYRDTEAPTKLLETLATREGIMRVEWQ